MLSSEATDIDQSAMLDALGDSVTNWEQNISNYAGAVIWLKFSWKTCQPCKPQYLASLVSWQPVTCKEWVKDSAWVFLRYFYVMGDHNEATAAYQHIANVVEGAAEDPYWLAGSQQLYYSDGVPTEMPESLEGGAPTAYPGGEPQANLHYPVQQ